jgi:hypothetical protein
MEKTPSRSVVILQAQVIWRKGASPNCSLSQLIATSLELEIRTLYEV